MAVIEGGVSGALAGVGAEAASPLHVVNLPVSVGAGGAYRLGAVSGTMAVSLAANSEIFQFRYVTAASRLALVYKVSFSAGALVAATAAALANIRMCVARSWTAAGSGGTRINLTGNNCKLRTSYATSEVNDAGISTTAALTAGTKTLDTTDISNLANTFLTGAITVATQGMLFPETDLFNAADAGYHPLVLANQEGFILRNGTVFPAGATWSFAVKVSWLEVPAF